MKRKIFIGAAFGIILIIGIVLSFVFIQKISISDDSMSPTYSAGTKLLLLSHVSSFHRGDIVAVQNENGKVIRRIIGLPGETIEIKEQKVFINGKVFNAPYVHSVFCSEPEEASGKSVTTLYGEPISSKDFSQNDTIVFPNTKNTDCSQPFVLRSDEFFVLGDNQSTAIDSRQLGSVKKSSIQGKILGKAWM